MDVLLRKSLVNINIKEHTVNYLLELAAQKNDFEIADYIFRNYYNEGCETNAKTEVKNMLRNIKRLSSGQPAPELEMINPDSKRTKLYDIKDKKLVLVYFWSSTCGHCRESIPNLKKLYEANKEKGLEIYGVSLDSEYYNWAVYVEQEKLNWINVSELKGWQSKAVELYTVTGTPSYFLLDGSNFKIIARYSNIEQLEKELKQKL
jgi:peroxiredoxin